MIIVIDGITIKPYVRMTQKGKWSSPQAQEYMASKTELELRYRECMAKYGDEMLPGQTPLWVFVSVTVPQKQGQ